MNLPNKLTIIRICLVPPMMVFVVFDFGLGVWANLIAMALFSIASITDMFDGKIARKRGLVTNFGKFLDPLADKFLVLGALVSMCLVAQNDVYGKLLLLGTAIVIFRELAVTSLRLIANKADGAVIAANIFGKIKTTLQIVFINVALFEPVFDKIIGVDTLRIPSYICLCAMAVMTVFSGATYVKSYWKYIAVDK
jgi:CDP-diacylglycerol--glycerol-3-phosphate 3-phosphatidyltransferase